MKNIRYIIVALFVAFSAAAGVAQTALSSYFLDGTLYNSKLNPAMDAESNYVSIAVGNLSLRTKGNVGVSTFLYPRGENELATFMSGSVGKEEFLGKLPEVSRMGFNLDETLMAGGFRALGGYGSVGISLHSSVAVSLPKGLFEFAKNGLQKKAYSFSGVNISTMNYAAVTLGYSREVIKGLRVGANIKYLQGLAHADINIDKLNVELNDQHWLAESHATAQVAMFCEAKPTYKDDVVNGVELIGFVPKSSGFGVDLGAVYDMAEFVPGLKVSASVVDLGFIHWKHMMKGQSTDAKVEFDGFDEIDYNDMATSVDAEFEKLGNDAAKMVEFNYDGSEAVNTRLNTTMYVGAEYNMPFYDKLSVGALYGQCFSPFECNRWFDARGFVNVSPLSWFEATVNCGYTSYGTSLGWMLNFHPAGINFFIGSDHMITRVTPQFIPLNDLNTHLTLGINIAVGKTNRHVKKSKTVKANKPQQPQETSESEK